MIIHSYDKITERLALTNLVGKTIKEIKIIGHQLSNYELGFNSYGYLLISFKNGQAIRLSISCDRAEFSNDIIIISIEEIDLTEYQKSTEFPTLYYAPHNEFKISEIEVYGQKFDFHYSKSEIHSYWLKGQTETESNTIDYLVDSENAIMFKSIKGKRIFLAHDTSPRFEIATSEEHIQHLLSHEYGFENGYFQLKRTIS